MTTNYVTKFNAGGNPADTSAPIFDNGGLVGIGTTNPNPSTRLHLRATDASGAYGGTIVPGTICLVDATGSSQPARLAILKGSGAEILNFGGNSDSDEAGIQYDPNTHKLGFKTNGTDNQVIIDGSGLVGIGTTAPVYPLDVHYHGVAGGIAINGDAQGTPDLGYGGKFIGGEVGVRGEASVTGGSGERIGGEFQAQNGVDNYAIKATVFGSTNPNANVNIAGYFYADRENNHGDFYCGYFEGPDRVYIGGSVGIGTTNPGVKLVVSGNAVSAIQETVANSNTAGASVIALSETADGGTYNCSIFRFGSTHPTKANAVEFINHMTSYLALGANNTEQIRITSGGNVGIGLTNPGQKLEVYGNIKTSGQVLLGAVQIKTGAGAPNNNDGAPKGSLYLRTDGGTSTTLYVKTASTTWTAK